MDLRSKLNFYKQNSDSLRSSGNDSTNIKENAADSKELKCGRHDSRNIGNMPNGTVISNGYGSFYIIENKYPLSYSHGGCSLGSALDVSPECLAALCGIECSRADIKRLLYLDTETTGLSGGAGTVAFLVGTGYFADDAFVIRQYFMRDYDEETAMLHGLDELLAGFDGLVTFNGKAFDWNLLSGRFIANRIKPSMADPLQADLLYPARRIWGSKYESCRLSSLEENVLGEKRCGDIPGALIPSVYFRFLEDGDTAEIGRVIKHNGLDILSMIPLLVRLCKMIEKPLSNSDGEHELLGLGRIFEARGELDRMVECFENCTKSPDHTIRSKAVKRLTGIYKRKGSYGKAMEQWRGIIADSNGFDLFAMVQIAMYYEHRTNEVEKALDIVDSAVQACVKAGLTGSRQFDELRRRQERLRRKALKNEISKG